MMPIWNIKSLYPSWSPEHKVTLSYNLTKANYTAVLIEWGVIIMAYAGLFFVLKDESLHNTSNDGGDGIVDFLMHDACGKGNRELVLEMITKGADINAQVDFGLENGETPLHAAAQNGQIEISRLLIAREAYVNIKSKKNKTPLDLAIGFNNPEIATLLRKFGGKTSEQLKAEGK